MFHQQSYIDFLGSWFNPWIPRQKYVPRAAFTSQGTHFEGLKLVLPHSAHDCTSCWTVTKPLLIEVPRVLARVYSDAMLSGVLVARWPRSGFWTVWLDKNIRHGPLWRMDLASDAVRNIKIIKFCTVRSQQTFLPITTCDF